MTTSVVNKPATNGLGHPLFGSSEGIPAVTEDHGRLFPIEQNAPPNEKENLLAVTQVLAYLRYTDVGLLTIFGGRKIMLESPLIDELVMEKYGDLLIEKTREAAREAAREASFATACETARQNIVAFLEARFGDVPRDVVDGIASVVDEKQLKSLVRLAGSCPDLDGFRSAVTRI